MYGVPANTFWQRRVFDPGRISHERARAVAPQQLTRGVPEPLFKWVVCHQGGVHGALIKSDGSECLNFWQGEFPLPHVYFCQSSSKAVCSMPLAHDRDVIPKQARALEVHVRPAPCLGHQGLPFRWHLRPVHEQTSPQILVGIRSMKGTLPATDVGVNEVVVFMMVAVIAGLVDVHEDPHRDRAHVGNVG